MNQYLKNVIPRVRIEQSGLPLPPLSVKKTIFARIKTGARSFRTMHLRKTSILFCLSGILILPLLSMAQENGPDLQELLARADYYEYLNEDSCLYFANQAYTESVVQKDKMAQALSLAKIANAYQSKGEYEKALSYAQSLRDLSQQLHDDALFAQALMLTGTVYLDMGIFDAAYTHLTQAITIFQQEPETNSAKLGNGYNALGVLSAKQSQYEQAQAYFEKGLSLIDTLRDKQQIVLLNSNLALCCIYNQEIAKGEQLLKDQIQQVLRQNIPYNLTFLQLSLCRIYIESGNYDQALEYGEKALSSAEAKNNLLSTAQSLYYIGYIHFITQHDPEALSCFLRADSIARDLELLDIQAYAAGHIATLYESKGNYEQAYRYAIRQNEANNALNRKTNRENLYRLRHEYQYKQQLAEMESEDTRRTRRYIFTTAFAGLTLLLLWIWQSRQKIKLQNIKLKQNQTALELEQKNKEITTKTLYLQQKNKLLADIVDRLEKAKHLFKTSNQPIIDQIIHELTQSTKDNSWEEFELRFEQVHTGFFKKLNERFPNLSPTEKRLCAYLKLNMNSKEIAALTHTTVGNVEQARFRLRKKMGLHGTDINLLSFIEGL